MGKPKPEVTVRETDLYPPLRHYFEHHGYLVRSEVVNCDLTATKGDDLIVVELKRSANMKLLIQATDRLALTDAVYVAVPAPRMKRSEWRGIKRVLRMLELGLLTVDLAREPPRVDLIFDPLPYQRRKSHKRRRAVIQEIADRSGEYNTAGSNSRKILTAYRENAIQIACYLTQFGPLTPRQLRELGTGPKTLSILSNNHYGWFQRVQRGVYRVTATGEADLDRYPELTATHLSNLPDP